MELPGAHGALAGTLHWLAEHTYAVVFVGALVDATGLPFPGRLLLMAAGAVAASGRASLVTIIILAAAAAVILDHLWYIAAARGSTRMVALYRRLGGRVEGRRDRASSPMARSGLLTILLGRFFTSVRALVWPVVIGRGITYARFVVADTIAAATWASCWVLLGWTMGARWKAAAEDAGVWLTVAGAAALAIFVAPIAMRWWRSRAR